MSGPRPQKPPASEKVGKTYAKRRRRWGPVEALRRAAPARVRRRPGAAASGS